MLEIIVLGAILIMSGWVLQIGGLFVAIKAKERNSVNISKFGYYSLIVGEIITNSALVLTLGLIVSKILEV